jgi:putative spermidine/putrescine transport system permease protein
MVAASARLERAQDSPTARAWIFLRAHAELVPMLLLAPAVAVLAAFLSVPLVYFGLQSFQTNELVPSWTLDNYTHFFGDSLYVRMLGQSIWLGLQTTFFTLLLGYPLAYQLAFASRRAKPLLLFFLISPLLVGVVIRCYGWMILLADNGLINQWLKSSGLAPGGLPLMYNTFGIVVALVHVFLPYMVLSIVGVLRRIDPALVEAAQNLGATRPRIFWEVIWPLTIPGVAAGCLLVFSLAISSYVVPILLGGFKVLLLPIVIYDEMLSLYDWPFGAANAMVLLAISLAILVAYFGLVDRLSRRLST